MSTQSTTTDAGHIVIAGGGLVGRLLAILLARQSDYAITVLEGSTPRLPSNEGRVLALAAGSCQLLQSLGIWPTAEQPPATPITHIHVSDKGHLGKLRLHSDDWQLASFGHVLSAAALYQQFEQVLQPLREQKRVRWLQPASIAKLTHQAGHIDLSLTDGQSLTAQLLVVAEGGGSSTRQMLGLQPQNYDYQQHALVVNVKTSQPHEGWAYERFTEHGPMALLPMAGDQRSLVWTVTPEQLPELLALSDSDFLARLQRAFGYRAGRFCAVAQRYHYPLTLLNLQQVTAPRTIIMGNAAHALHPIAGQGFNLGLRDAQVLAHMLADKADCGDAAAIQAYQEQRSRDQQKMVNFTHALAIGFSQSSRLVALPRNLALIGLAACQNLQQPIIRAATGLGSPYNIAETL